MYRHILAVTFTNKATDEMKSRILEELSRLGSGKSSPILEFISKENNLSRQEVAQRALILLESILHNYSRFHVETIDRFFQRAIRAFTRELGLAGGYRIELDTERILSEAVDGMLAGLGDDPRLLKWFVEFARERVQEGKSWNLKRDLMVLGKELGKESFQVASGDLVRQLEDREKLASFLAEIRKIKDGFEGSLKAYAREALRIMEKENLQPADFKGAYGVGHFFPRLLKEDFKTPNATVLGAVDEPSEWHTRNSGKKQAILSAYQAGMNELLKKCLGLYTDSFRAYLSAESVRTFLHTLGILTDISGRMHALTEMQGIFLLSESATFLRGIIGENDTPFVYEKTGNYFHHFMIDEFQDTSGMQWSNLKPLIGNSLAYGRKCLVVGDVKQSIYRWRNSDWEILSEQLPGDFSPEQIELQGLQVNWRSRENIIRFNNDFFTRAREVMSDHFREDGGDPRDYSGKTQRAYSDVKQEIPADPGKKGGYIRVSLIPQPEKGEWKKEADRQVISEIERHQERGVRPSEMAILVRTKREGKRIADAILAYKSLHPDTGFTYDVISGESLYLVNAISVRIILNAFRFLVAPEDRLSLVQLVYEYNLFMGRIPELQGDLDGLLGFLRMGETPALPEGFRDGSLRYLTLTELTERIIDLFSLGSQSSQTPYILGFQDLVLEYCRGGAADINSFLDWWDENGTEQSLTVSEDQEAIRVMTIHKAKGLEFKVVIIPYCNWSFDHRSPHPEILWCRPNSAPFNQFRLLPVRYSSALTDTIFEGDYREEKFRVYMDHLNLLYVAFTRARESLVVMAPRGKSGKFTEVSSLLERILLEPGSPRGGTWDEAEHTWTSGQFTFGPPDPGVPTQIMLKRLSSHEFSGKLRLIYRGRDFFDQDAEKRVRYGTLMHEIFSRIHSSGDVDRALDSVRREGLIDSLELDRLREEIVEMIAREQSRAWFDGSWRVITEQDILTRDGSVRRPDRVMMKPGRVIVVDYKFGQQRSPAHLSQIRRYTEMLRQMKYEDARGFIWYVNRKEVVEVE